MTPQEVIARTIELNPWMKSFADKMRYKCHDCGATIGQQHEEGCDTARCTNCKGQRMMCDCEAGQPDVWTGLMYVREHKVCLERNIWARVEGVLKGTDEVVGVPYSDAIQHNLRPNESNYKTVQFHVPCRRDDLESYANLNRGTEIADLEDLPLPEFVSPV